MTALSNGFHALVGKLSIDIDLVELVEQGIDEGLLKSSQFNRVINA